jgi:hypothetical protein
MQHGADLSVWRRTRAGPLALIMAAPIDEHRVELWLPCPIMPTKFYLIPELARSSPEGSRRFPPLPRQARLCSAT